MWIATGAAGAGDISLIPLYYTLSIIALVSGIWFGVAKFWSKTRKQWVDEGERQRRQAEAMELNTQAAQRNTEAIGHLTRKLDGFTDDVRKELNGHNDRIGILERRLP